MAPIYAEECKRVNDIETYEKLQNYYSGLFINKDKTMLKTIPVKNGRVHREKCYHCGQLLPKARVDHLDTPDIRKIKRIIKRNSLTQTQLAEIIGISQGTVAGWFRLQSNNQGKIKKIYFDVLKSKGYL